MSLSSHHHHLQQLQTKGYTVFKDVIPKSMISSLREHVRRGVLARPEAFLEIANPADVLNQEVKQEDPRMTALKRKFSAHRQKRKKMLKQKREEKRRGAARARREGEDDESYEFRTKDATSATASDIAKLSQRITQQLAELDPSDSRLQNDPQRLKAINEHRCNLWMTESQTIGKNYIRGDFGKILGQIASTLSTTTENDSTTFAGGGIQNPILFSDRPMFQLPYGRPSMMHFAAPFFGLEEVRGSVNDNNSNNGLMNAISLWVPLEEPMAPTEENFKIFNNSNNKKSENLVDENGQRLTRRRARLLQQQQQQSSSSSPPHENELELLPTPIRVLEGSHILVRQKLLQDPKRYDVRLFRNDFNAVDSAIALWLRRFPELMPPQNNMSNNMNRPHDAPFTTISSQEQQQQQPLVRAVELPDIRPGTVVAFDPYTFCGLGPNVSTHSQCVMQFLINNGSSGGGGGGAISTSTTTKPSVHPYSWIRDWKSSSLSVDFGNDIVFPKLY